MQLKPSNKIFGDADVESPMLLAGENVDERGAGNTHLIE